MIKHMGIDDFNSLELYFEYTVGNTAEELIFNGSKRKVKYEER